MREILLAVGEDPERDGLLETPARVARMYAEVFSGLQTDPRIYLRKTFDAAHEEMVVVRDIDFGSMCEHHLLPFTGKAHIGYLPSGKIVGLSKLARIVEAISHRPQVQERMTSLLADLVMDELGCRRGRGRARGGPQLHGPARGAQDRFDPRITSAMRGTFKTNPATRAEFLSLIHSPRTARGV